MSPLRKWWQVWETRPPPKIKGSIKMRDIIFAWIFAVTLWCILPYAQISRLETAIAFSYFFVVGLYLYAVIERKFYRNRRRKYKSKKRNEYKERRSA